MSAYASRIFAAAVAAATLLFPIIPGLAPSWITLSVYIGLAALVALGLVLMTGVGGITSFGQAAFVGIGAYTTAYLTTAFGLSPWATLPLSLLVTGVGAVLIGIVTVPLAGHYLAIATIAWGVSAYYLFGTITAFGLNNGLFGIPPLMIGGYALIDPKAFYYVLWIALVVALILTFNLLSSRTGRAIRSLRSNAVVARSFGVNVVRAKLLVFVYAAVLAGLSGWLFAHFQRAVSPSSFGVEAGLEYLLMTVVGGAGHVYGALMGAAIIVSLRSELQFLMHNVLGVTGNYEVIVLGAILIVVLHAAREGIWPFLKRFWPTFPTKVPSRATLLPRGVMPKRGSPILQVEAARMQFGGLVAVNDVSFDVATGEVLGLIGPNGAGKSTTFNMLTGVLMPTAGRITFLGERIDGKSPQFVAGRRIARTFQHAKVIGDMSVLDNVALGAHMRAQSGPIRAMLRLNREEDERMIFEAARQIERVGLAAEMHKNAGNLALGQVRLVEIARALALDPVLLLLDEPAAGLRHNEKQALAALLRKLRDENVTILLVEHDMDFVMNLVDRMVVLNFGTKIADGRPADVRLNRAVQEAYLGAAE